jgi:hypothetical protein
MYIFSIIKYAQAAQILPQSNLSNYLDEVPAQDGTKSKSYDF